MMTSGSITNSFNKHFKMHFVNTAQLKAEAFKVRHDVYCRELGWEKVSENQQETDGYDDLALHCLFQHRGTQKFFACFRLITATINNINELPFAKFYPNETFTHLATRYDSIETKTKVAEVSRLVVTQPFRTQNSAWEATAEVNGMSQLVSVLNKEQMNVFPYIAVGLYLSSIALAAIQGCPAMVAMMEPRLYRRLQKLGLPIQQIGECVEHRGKRASYLLEYKHIAESLNADLQALYQSLYSDLSKQMSLG